MESVGRLAGGVAHDFNNMLNVILGHTELALDDLPGNSPLRDDLDEIRKAAERSANLTRQLLAFARKQTVEPRILDLNETITSMLKMLQRLIGEDIDLLWKPGARLALVRIDPGQVDQVLANLVVNARDAIGHQNGKVTIETANARFDEEYCADHAGFTPGEYVMLAVSDDGCGMDEETRANIFEPFFTTKATGQGTGLGLATIYGITKQNDGFVNVYSEPGKGSTFRIYIPALGAESRQEDGASTLNTAPVGGNENILIVEDEAAILNMARAMLTPLGYNILTASTPSEALRVARDCECKIDLVITDVVMPEMNGRDLAEQMQALYPGLKNLFMSGYTANVIAHQGVLDKGVNFIQKPFSQKDLAEKVRKVLDRESKG
jgi:two-component system, cell cycle sensor histidine kinase and response regulator CckA